MSIFFQSQLFLVQIYREILNFYHSPGFWVVKFILVIYTFVLFADLILLLIARGVGGNLREMRMGMDIPEEFVTKRKQMRLRWNEIRKRLESGNESEYKVAIIEADNIIDDLIKRMGFSGENLGERLEKARPGQIDYALELKQAHEVRNRIIHEDGFQLSREDAAAILENYEKFLRVFEVLD